MMVDDASINPSKINQAIDNKLLLDE